MYLVISSLAHIISDNYFEIGFNRYAAVMERVNLVSITATLTVLWIAFSRCISKHYSVESLDPPRSAIKNLLVFRAAFPLLTILLIAYFVTVPLGISIAFVTGTGAILLMVIAGRWWQAGHRAIVSVSSARRGAP